MEQFYFQPLPDDKPEFHVDDIPGEENPKSHHRMRFTAFDGRGKQVEVTLELTIPQLVEVVKHFFWQPTITNMVMYWFLVRLLKKRWALCTNEQTKNQDENYKTSCTRLDFEWLDGRPVMRRT